MIIIIIKNSTEIKNNKQYECKRACYTYSVSITAEKNSFWQQVLSYKCQYQYRVQQGKQLQQLQYNVKREDRDRRTESTKRKHTSNAAREQYNTP